MLDSGIASHESGLPPQQQHQMDSMQRTDKEKPNGLMVRLVFVVLSQKQTSTLQISARYKYEQDETL